jgi:uncharacterized membrane protein
MSAARGWLADLRRGLGSLMMLAYLTLLLFNLAVGVRDVVRGAPAAPAELLVAVLVLNYFAMTVERVRCPLGHKQMLPNQAVISASIEPSADMREAARSMTEIRVALIAAGYTPEQASRQIADVIAAGQRGAS